VGRNFVKKVPSQELQLPAHAKAIVLAELQIAKHHEVKIHDEFGFAAGMRELAIGESASNRKEMIGYALHGGDDHDDVGCPRGGANEACGMEHAVRTEKRTAAELEGDEVPALLACPPARCSRSCKAAGLPSAADSSCTFSRLMTCAPGFPLRFQPLERLWKGLKEETHRQVRFWRWVGNFLLVR